VCFYAIGTLDLWDIVKEKWSSLHDSYIVIKLV